MKQSRHPVLAAAILLASMRGATALYADVAGPFTYLGPSGLGGRVHSIVFHPSDPNAGWFAALGGGVFKTTNGGASWFPVGDGMTNLFVTTLVVDPANPSILYAGTGEGHGGIDEIPGDGIHRSTDGGLTWTHLAATDTVDFQATNELALNPAQPTHLYAATRRGVFRSTDSGTSWTGLYTTSVNDPGKPDCRDIAVKPGSAGADVVLASCLADHVIVRNPDAAGAGAFTVVKTEAQLGKANLAFAPSSSNLVYALASKPGTLGNQVQVEMLALFKSTDAGATWSDVVRQDGNYSLLRNLLLSSSYTSAGCAGAPYIIGEGNLKNAFAVDPVDPNRLYAGGEDFYRSTDGGLTWGLAASGVFGSMRSGHFAIAFPAGYDGIGSQTMWVANDTGLYKTTNAVSGTLSTNPCAFPTGTITFSRQNVGHAAAQLLDGAVAPGGATYYGGSVGFDVVKGTEAGGPTGWTSLDTSLGNPRSCVLVDPSSTSVLYRGGFNQGLGKSTNGGTSWAAADSGQTGLGAYRSNTVFHPTDSSKLMTGREQMFRTTNGGASWTAASTALGSNRTMLRIAIAPSNPDRVAATAFLNTAPAPLLRLFTTTTGTTSGPATVWTERTPGGESRYGHALAFDPANPDILWIHRTTGGRVSKSTDFGATWTARANGLPDEDVTAILVDPVVPGRLFAGTNEGLYATTDGGGSWARETGIPRASISRLVLDGRKLYAFTLGRGAWRAALDVVGSRFNTVTPCRVLDTRNANGPFGGPALAPMETRSIPVSSSACGIPSNATSIAVNMTVVSPTAAGYLTVFAGDGAMPATSSLNFTPGATRANNAVTPFASNGSGTVRVFNGSTGTSHVILDVSGYFQ